VIDPKLCTADTCVVGMDVTAMGMAMVPIVEVFEWERRGWRCAMGEITATAAIEGHATALVVSTTIIIASVESVSTTAIVGATTAAAGLSLLVLILLLAKLVALCLTILVVLLWNLKQASRGLVANCIAGHMDLSCVALMEALLLRRLSCVVAYVTPKLKTASVKEAAVLSSLAFMP
jgi:hypothetical protein